MDDREAKNMLEACFTQESQGLHESFQIHQNAVESYKAFLDPLDYVDRNNRSMHLMSQSTLQRYLQTNRMALRNFLKGNQSNGGTSLHNQVRPIGA